MEHVDKYLYSPKSDTYLTIIDTIGFTHNGDLIHEIVSYNDKNSFNIHISPLVNLSNDLIEISKLKFLQNYQTAYDIFLINSLKMYGKKFNQNNIHTILQKFFEKFDKYLIKN